MKRYLPNKFLDFFGNYYAFSHTEEVLAAFLQIRPKRALPYITRKSGALVLIINN